MQPFYRIARALVFPFYRFLFRTKVVGRENIPKSGSFIMCANHTSMSDPFFMAIYCKRQIFFMAKAELFKIPVVGFVVSRVGAFAVDRGKGDMSAIRHAEELIKNGRILGIFPEGTRHPSGPPNKAKSGVAYIAMDTKADILPVSLYREGKFGLFGKTTLRYGKPIPYSELVDENASERANIRRITERVTDEITKLWEMKY